MYPQLAQGFAEEVLEAAQKCLPGDEHDLGENVRQIVKKYQILTDVDEEDED